MADNFTSDPVQNTHYSIAGREFANIKDSTLKHNSVVMSASVAKVGKHPIIAQTITTTDVPSSEVVKDWEERNNKAVVQ